MAKFVLLLLVVAFVVMCSADEAKPETSSLDEIQASVDNGLKSVKEYISKHIDENKIKEFLEKFGENAKQFITQTQADVEKLSVKKE